MVHSWIGGGGGAALSLLLLVITTQPTATFGLRNVTGKEVCGLCLLSGSGRDGHVCAHELAGVA